ncbi:hypothetical protein ACJRO7_003435 [Eucalyptus globulus]|uniref:Uncharacterized protein n=1 Tax=Eucalyptus globulus TaxID=34317 RepID=A0ABD3IW87_EUCGL
MYHPYAMGWMERFGPRTTLSSGPGGGRQGMGSSHLRACTSTQCSRPGSGLPRQGDALVEMKSVALALVCHFDVHLANGHRRPQFVPRLTVTIEWDCRW